MDTFGESQNKRAGLIGTYSDSRSRSTSGELIVLSADILSPDEGNYNKKRLGAPEWSSALDLVSEAFEAIRLADERAAASEEYQFDLVQRHSEQLRTLEARIAMAEKRADEAENRATIAETWLAKYHDTINSEFQRVFMMRKR